MRKSIIIAAINVKKNRSTWSREGTGYFYYNKKILSILDLLKAKTGLNYQLDTSNKFRITRVGRLESCKFYDNEFITIRRGTNLAKLKKKIYEHLIISTPKGLVTDEDTSKPTGVLIGKYASL